MSGPRTPSAWRAILADVPRGAAVDTPTRAAIDATEDRFVGVITAHGVDVFVARLAVGGRPARLARWDATLPRELDGLARAVAWMALPPATRRSLGWADRGMRDDATEAEVWALRDALLGTGDDPGVDPVPRWDGETVEKSGIQAEAWASYTRKTTDRPAERPAPAALGWFGAVER